MITFDRNLEACIALATAVMGTPLYATTLTSGPTVTVVLRSSIDEAGTDAEFYVAVFC